MSIFSRAGKPLVVTTAVLAVTAGLALSPFGISAASASNSSSAASIISKINSYRSSNDLSAFSTNTFLSEFTQDWAAYAAKKNSYKVDPPESAQAIPTTSATGMDDQPSDGDGGVAKVVKGSASTVYSYLKKVALSDFISEDFNYVGVGYAKHGTTVYAAILFLDYDATPVNKISESKPTVSGSVKVGSTLTAVPHFSPAADPDSLTYTWKSGSTTLSTDSTYTVLPADAGTKITLTITGSKAGYAKSDETTTLLSSTSSSYTVAKGTLTKGTPKVNGIRTVGEILTGDSGDWGPSDVTLTVKWLRDGKTIAGTTGETSYTQVAADKGHKIDFEVTGTDAGYTTASKSTATKTKTTAP